MCLELILPVCFIWIKSMPIFHPTVVACLSFRILVNMDDNIIEHYTNQSAFLIEISEGIAGQLQVILVEVWDPASNQLPPPTPLKDVSIYSCQFKPFLKALPSHLQYKLWITEAKEDWTEETPPVLPTSVLKVKTFLKFVNTASSGSYNFVIWI